MVGIRNGNEVVSISKKDQGVWQFFFKNGQITGFNFGMISGPGQPLNREPVVDQELRTQFMELNQGWPEAAKSLGHCLVELENPGPSE